MLKTTKEYPEALKSILERGNAGDLSVLPDLKKAFDEHPELAAQLGDMVWHAEQSLLDLATGSSLTAKEAIARQAAALRERLRATAASELEKLLIDRIVIGWIEVYHSDVDLARHLHAHLGDTPAHRSAERRHDGAHRRFLAAVKALATIQKLARPAPSPVELAQRPIPETAARPPVWKDRGRLPTTIAVVEN